MEILTTRKVGKEGDIAEVEKFNRAYIAVRILQSRETAQRLGKYLRFLVSILPAFGN